MCEFRRLLAWFCFLPLLAACHRASDREWMGTVTDSAGVRIVHNPPEGVWNPGNRWTVTEELRIGVVAGKPEYEFGALVGIDIDEAGNVYVLDQLTQVVRVFDSNGAYLNTFGGAGSGPGELGPGASGIWIGPDGRVWVADLGNSRLNFYLPDGTSDGSFPLPLSQLGGALGTPMRWTMSHDGGLLVQLLIYAPPGQSLPGGLSPGYAIVEFDRTGVIADTVHVFPFDPSVESSGGRGRITLFSASPVWDLAPDGTFVSAMNSTYRVAFWSRDGRLTQVLTRESTLKVVTDADKEAILQSLGALYTKYGNPPARVQRQLQAFSFAETYPAFLTFLVADEGSLWVQQIQTPDQMPPGGDFNPMDDLGSNGWDIFDKEGRYLGELLFPEGFTPLKLVGDSVWGIARDELGAHYAVRLMLMRPSS